MHTMATNAMVLYVASSLTVKVLIVLGKQEKYRIYPNVSWS